MLDKEETNNVDVVINAIFNSENTDDISLDSALTAIQEGNAAELKNIPAKYFGLIPQNSKNAKALSHPPSFLNIAIMAAYNLNISETDRNAAREIAMALLEKYPSKFLNKTRGEESTITPLQYAVWYRQPEIALALIEKMTKKQLTPYYEETSKFPLQDVLSNIYNAENQQEAKNWESVANQLLGKIEAIELYWILHDSAGDGADISGMLSKSQKIRKEPNPTLNSAGDGADISGMLSKSQKIRKEPDPTLNKADIVDNISWKIIQKLEKQMYYFNDRYRGRSRTPLLCDMIRFHSPLAARYIKEYPANKLNSQDIEGNTPLMTAIREGSNDVAFKLIEKLKPNQLNVQNNEGDTALMMGVWFSLVEIVQPLISRLRGIDLNTKNKEGKTALMIAIEKGQADVVVMLASKLTPKQLNTKNKAGETALTLAKKIGNVDIIGLLQDRKVSLFSERNSEDNIEMKRQASDLKNRNSGH